MKTPDTEKCEHKVVKKYCFRCKRPDLAGNVKNTPDTAHAVYQSTEADKCPKCGEDHRLISRCKTPDTEWEKEFEAEFMEYAAENENTLIDSDTDGKRVKQFIRSLLTSRDTYWKERVEEVGRKIAQDIATYKSYWNPIGDERNTGRHYACDDILPQVQSLLKKITKDNLK